MPRSKAKKDAATERRANRPARIDPHQAYSINETCAALDLSRPQFYVLLRSRRLRVIDPPLDSRPRVSGSEILRLLGAAPESAAA